MIAGLCGTHGTGKSTIINGIRDLDFPVNDTQLSREVQKAFGWTTLDAVKEDEEMMWKFQEAVLGAMYDRDVEIKNSGKLTLVERTPADVWAYTSLWCDHFSISTLTSARARKFRAMCQSMASNYKIFLFLPTKDEIKFVSEKNRANIDSRETVENSIKGFIWDSSLPVHIVSSISKSDRIEECYIQLIIERIKLL